MKIWASVLSFRETEMTLGALQSLRDQGESVDHLEVIANGCGDTPEAELSAFFPGVDVVRQPENLSFSESVNGAFERARESGYDAVFFLTNDAELAPGAMPHLARALTENRRLAAVMPVQMRYDNHEIIHHGGGEFDRLRWAPEIVFGGEPVSALPAGGIESRAWVDGAAVLYRLDAIQEIGGLWPGFGFYWEDVDFGLSALRHGWEVAVCFDAIAYHRVSATSQKNLPWLHYMLARNRLLCAWRHLAPKEFVSMKRRLVNSALLLAIRSPHRVQQRMRLRATLDVARGRAESPPSAETFR